MNKPTYQDLKQYHYDLWNWLSKNPDYRKEAWPEWASIRDNPKLEYSVERYCFACQAAAGDCAKCPLVSEEYVDSVDVSSPTLPCADGLYRQYYNSSSLPERSRLAGLIRDKWGE